MSIPELRLLHSREASYLEMLAPIFLLFVSFNGGFDDLNTTQANLEPSSTTELVAAWGEPDSAVFADHSFASSQFDTARIWSSDDPERSVLIRDNIVVSIQEG